jgi:predicted dehydrogenase
VLCEKPLCQTAREAEQLVDLADKEKIKLGVAFHLRFHVLHQQAKELIGEGRFGRVNLIRMQNHMNYPVIDGAWRQDPALSGGGGPSMDVGSHHIDLMCYLTGSDVVEITAVAANQVYHYKVEDIALILLKFANGTAGMIDLSWNTPNRLNMFEIYGSRATLYCEKTVGPFKDPYGRLLENESVTELTPDYLDTYMLEAEAFARWIEFDEPFLIPGSEGLKNNRLLEKVNESIRLQKTVKI